MPKHIKQMHLLNNLGSKHSMLMEIWQVYIILQKKQKLSRNDLGN